MPKLFLLATLLSALLTFLTWPYWPTFHKEILLLDLLFRTRMTFPRLSSAERERERERERESAPERERERERERESCYLLPIN
jgi:uncharacterized membrane protein YccC